MTVEDLKKLQDENKLLKGKIDELTSEKARAETEKAVAVARRDAILARLPASDTKALEGRTTADSAVVTGVQRQAHRALREVVARMAGAIFRLRPGLKTVLLYHERDLTSLAQYRVVRNELDLLREGYDAAPLKVSRAPGPATAAMVEMAALAPAAVGAVLKSTADVLALFRTDVDYKGAAVSFDDASLAAEVARGLRRAYASGAERGDIHDSDEPARPGERERRRGEGGDGGGDLEVIYSALSVPGLHDTAADRKSELIESLAEVAALREEAGIAVAAFDALEAAAKNADPGKERVARLKGLNARYDRLLTGLVQLDDKTNLTALAALLRGEMLSRKMRGGEGAVLFVKATGGGENKTTRNLFTDIFTGGRLYHSGTAVLTYLLFSNGGDLILSDVLTRTTAFVKAA